MNEWTKMSLEDVKKRVIAAICSLYRYDRELLEVDANERGVRCVISSSARFYFPPHGHCQEFRRGFSAVASDWPAVAGWPNQPPLTPRRTKQG